MADRCLAHFPDKLHHIPAVFQNQIRTELSVDLMLYDHVTDITAAINIQISVPPASVRRLGHCKNSPAQILTVLRIIQHISFICAQDIAVGRTQQCDVLHDHLAAHAKRLCQFRTGPMDGFPVLNDSSVLFCVLLHPSYQSP